MSTAPTTLPPLLASLKEVLAHRPKPRKANPDRRAAAVLVPFFYRDNDLRIVLTLRTESVPTHKGQVAFPGGAVDSTDGTLLDAALREAHEELGIDRSSVVPIGPLRPFNTRVSDFVLYPFCGYLPQANPVFVPQPSEVDQVLEVSLEDLRHHSARKRGLVPGFSRMVPIPLPYYKVDSTVIWGASGAVVDDLLHALDETGQ